MPKEGEAMLDFLMIEDIIVLLIFIAILVMGPSVMRAVETVVNHIER